MIFMKKMKKINKFEAVNDENVISKACLEGNLSEINGHLSL